MAKAKTDAVFFAFGRGKTPDDSILVLDRKKKPEALFKALHAEKGITKGAWGTVMLEGAIAAFSPVKMLTGLEKDLKALFKREKLSLKIAIVGD
ncbi:MAG: hypothetical protein P4M00_08450 [Azospirillaceae bacterium]|nr:hypothetical protein [Azospirillaceae bacterium]